MASADSAKRLILGGFGIRNGAASGAFELG